MTSSITHSASNYAARTPPGAHQSNRSLGGGRDEPYYFEPFGDDGLTFGDVLDVINPLQHIPVVSTFYREWTGDQIDPVPRIAGGALFGGVMGAVTSLVNVIVDEITGSDVGEHIMAFAGDLLGIGDTDAPEMYARATVSPAPGDQPLALAVAGGAAPLPAPVAASVDVLEWPRLGSDRAADGTLRALGQNPTVNTLDTQMASVREGKAVDTMVMSLSMYEKSEHSAKERIVPRIDILS